MSNLKKMRLVDDSDSNKQDELTKLMKYKTSVQLQRMSDLDNEMKNILNQNIDEETKARLYGQALRRFLSFKQNYQEETSLKESSHGVSIRKPKKRTALKLSTKRKQKIKTPKKGPSTSSDIKRKKKKKNKPISQTVVKEEEPTVHEEFLQTNRPLRGDSPDLDGTNWLNFW